MKLYDSAMAPNPRRVRIFLAEKGIEVPTEQGDIGKAENRQAPFPSAKLPSFYRIELRKSSTTVERMSPLVFTACEAVQACLGNAINDMQSKHDDRKRVEIKKIASPGPSIPTTSK